jgi:hypothetical protein
VAARAVNSVVWLHVQHGVYVKKKRKKCYFCWNKCWERVYCAGQDNIKLYATYEGQHRLACMSVDPIICQVNPVYIPSVLRNVVTFFLRDVCLSQQTATPERGVSSSHLHAILLNKDQFYLSVVIDLYEPTFTQLFHCRLCASRT